MNSRDGGELVGVERREDSGEIVVHRSEHIGELLDPIGGRG